MAVFGSIEEWRSQLMGRYLMAFGCDVVAQLRIVFFFSRARITAGGFWVSRV